VNDELGTGLKEVVVAYLNDTFWHVRGGTEVEHEKKELGQD